MSGFLKNHPFAVEAFFESSLVLTFAAPAGELQKLLPECLAIDSLHEQYGFIAVAMVQTKSLRPKGFPSFLGNDFFLIGYRIFVRYVTSEGKRLRGLYILRSETDKRLMNLLGNVFTHYNYSRTDISMKREGTTQTIFSEQSGFSVTVEDQGEAVPLPAGSPFSDWKEARRFAGPLPFTFTYFPEKKEVLLIEGVRENWTPSPVHVKSYHFDFLDQLQIPGLQLANAFVIRNIPYYWKKGRIDPWKK